MRTAFTPQELIAAIEASSTGPSNKPQPCAHAYSLPDRLTPATRSGAPQLVTSWLPDTEIPGGPAGNASNAFANAHWVWLTPLHVFDVHCDGDGHCWSRFSDQYASRPRPLPLANATSFAASAVVKISLS